MLAVLVGALLEGEPPPSVGIDWDRVEERIQVRWPAVRSVTHDSADDFVTIVVTDGTTDSVAAEASCVTVQPTLDAAGSRALFAIYTESGDIVASWNRCLFRTPEPET